MKVVIAGGSGFLGRALAGELSRANHEVVVFSRGAVRFGGVRAVAWDGSNDGAWMSEIDGADAVVNYAGSPILARWTAKTKALILASRVDATAAIGRAIVASTRPPSVWINGSATGYYGDTGEAAVDEASPLGRGFLPDVCAAWEAAASEVKLKSTRLVLLRTGLVLQKTHPPLSAWLMATRFFVGGRIGSGQAYVPWIDVDDHARLVQWALAGDVEGPVNAVSPNPVRNSELMATLRRVIGRPAAPPLPAFAVTLAGKLGAPAEAILGGSRVLPRTAERGGFEWRYPDLDACLTHQLSA